MAEEAQGIHTEDPVGAAGDVAEPEQVVAVDREREEDLQEEQRHDGEVVADEPP